MKIVDNFKLILNKETFDKLISKNKNEDYNSLLLNVYCKFGIQKTFDFIEKYFDNDIMYLDNFDILGYLNDKELDIVKNKLLNYPNIVLKETVDKIWLENVV